VNVIVPNSALLRFATGLLLVPTVVPGTNPYWQDCVEVAVGWHER
jgi:hypothetical protein